jgi:Putative zinc-finger
MQDKDKTRRPQPPNPGGVDCAEFEVLLADALDGRLGETQIERFDSHLEKCPRCAPMFGEAKLGQAWLQTLKSDELDPPAFVMENILRETVGTLHMKVKPQVAEPRLGWFDRLKEMPVFKPVYGTVMQPRFAMSFGMAFFSITMLMNVLGIKVSSFKHVDLRPTAISRQYHEAKGKVVKYYENLRLVYQLEVGVNDLKKVTQPTQEQHQQQQPQQDQGGQENKKSKPENRETSGAPELKRTLRVVASSVQAGQMVTTGRSIAS